MIESLTPVAFALFLWWFSTGAIFFLNARHPSSHRWSMLGTTVVLALALYGLAMSTTRTDVAGAYLGFTCGLLIWGWQTASHFFGFITGPNKDHCPPEVSDWHRFNLGLATGLYHEIVSVVTVCVLLALSLGQPNQFGLWTFVMLWGMHTSAKLNVFLGVRNLYAEFLPAHMDHLKSYFRKRSMNPLLPLSVIVGTTITVYLGRLALSDSATPYEVVGFTLLATLMLLAVIEHLLLVLPVSVSSLWNWSLSGEKDRVSIAG